MKLLKLTVIVWIAPLVAVIAGCAQPTTPLSAEERIDADAASISAASLLFASGDSASSVNHDFTVPTVGEHGSAISWESSVPDLLSFSGSTGHPRRGYDGTGQGDVTATATLSLSGLSREVSIDLSVFLWDYSGDTTYYDYNPSNPNSCGFTLADIPDGASIVAAPDFLNDSGCLCGTWVQLSSIDSPTEGSNAATVNVYVIENKPLTSESVYSFDLEEAAFAVLGATGAGKLLGLQWRFIEGPDATIQIRNSSGINEYYLSYTVSRMKYGLAKVEFKDSGAYASSWHEIPRAWGGVFDVQVSDLGGSSAFELPISVRLTDIHGNQVTATDAITTFAQGDIFDTNVQFPSGQGAGTLADFGL